MQNAYTDVDVWAVFRHSDGRELLRPGFWDGGQRWKMRFASPLADIPAKYLVIDPQAGQQTGSGELPADGYAAVRTELGEPRIVIFHR